MSTRSRPRVTYRLAWRGSGNDWCMTKSSGEILPLTSRTQFIYALYWADLWCRNRADIFRDHVELIVETKWGERRFLRRYDPPEGK